MIYRKLKNVFWRQPRWVQVVVLRAVRPGVIDSLLSLRSSEDGEQIIEEFHKHKCIFIHIPKTGGLSVKKSLFGTYSGGHRNLRSYKIIFNEREFKEYFKFAFVRNPWDRVVSAYEFLLDGGINESDQKWSKKVLTKYDSFSDFVVNWIDKENVYEEVHFCPQNEFIRLGDKNPRVDFLGRFEDFQNDFEKICKKINIESELNFENRSCRKRNYKEYYDSTTKQIVKEVYKKDIELFGYEF